MSELGFFLVCVYVVPGRIYGSITIHIAMRRKSARSRAPRRHAESRARVWVHTREEGFGPAYTGPFVAAMAAIGISDSVLREPESRRWRRVCAPPCLSFLLSLSLSLSRTRTLSFDPYHTAAAIPFPLSFGPVRLHLVALLVDEFPTFCARDGEVNFAPCASPNRTRKCCIIVVLQRRNNKYLKKLYKKICKQKFHFRIKYWITFADHSYSTSLKMREM